MQFLGLERDLEWWILGKSANFEKIKPQMLIVKKI